MILRYDGPHTAGVFIPVELGSDREAFVAHGADVEVSDALGASLLEQLKGDGSTDPIWTPVDDAAKAAQAAYWASIAAALTITPPPEHQDAPASPAARTRRTATPAPTPED